MAKLSIVVLLPLTTIASLAQSPCSFGLLHQNQPKLPSSSVPSTTLQYHKGALLTSPINVYLTWYGSFSPTHRSAITGFFSSFDPTPPLHPSRPTVSKWWSTIAAYKDTAGKSASTTVKLAGQAFDTQYSLGKALTRADLATLAKNAVAKGLLPFDPNGVYFILTSSDVTVDRFCMDSCGFHSTHLFLPGPRATLAHVGDPGVQCPGLCAWPFAVPAYSPPGPALVAPNGVGVDGMVVNIATVLAGAATNPVGDGYYQGDRLAPLEAVTACPGIFGPGAYPGYPGELMVDGRSKASFNVYGAGGRYYLLPAIWDPVSDSCKVVA